MCDTIGRLLNWKVFRYFNRRRQKYTTSNLESLRRDIKTDVHLLAAEDLLQSLQTNAVQGLSTTVARDLLNKSGLNALTPSRKASGVLKFLRRCFGGFSTLIWVLRLSTTLSNEFVFRW